MRVRPSIVEPYARVGRFVRAGVLRRLISVAWVGRSRRQAGRQEHHRAKSRDCQKRGVHCAAPSIEPTHTTPFTRGSRRHCRGLAGQSIMVNAVLRGRRQSRRHASAHTSPPARGIGRPSDGGIGRRPGAPAANRRAAEPAGAPWTARGAGHGGVSGQSVNGRSRRVGARRTAPGLRQRPRGRSAPVQDRLRPALLLLPRRRSTRGLSGRVAPLRRRLRLAEHGGGEH